MNWTNADYLQKLHSEILCIMDELDSICRCSGLKYYLTQGSLLGAVRHKGFIPWDDDFDIVMPRSDMNKLLQIISDNPDSKFNVEWHSTNSEYFNLFPKVCLKNTLFDEGIRKFPIGIFVDIFPLDLTGAYHTKHEKLKKKIARLNYISVAKFSTAKIGIKQLFKSIVPWKLLFYKCLSFFFNNDKCYSQIEKIALSAKRLGRTHYASFSSPYGIKKEVMPVDWYGDGINLEFEGRMYVAPTAYLKAVQSIYGANYYQLPPEDKRKTHYPIHVKFSDGIELSFEQPSKRVRYTDW